MRDSNPRTPASKTLSPGLEIKVNPSDSKWQSDGTKLTYYTCDKQVLWESAGAFFSARQLSDFTRQLARFTRSWSSGKMLAFQPRGFVFEPVGMR